MPHQCTNCGKTFADGSKEMLSGCPECGGNKFQFRPAGSRNADDGDAPSDDTSTTPDTADTASTATTPEIDTDTSAPPSESADAASETESERSGVTGTAAKAGASVREWVGNRTPESNETADSTVEENSAPVTEDRSDDSDVTIDPVTDQKDESEVNTEGESEVDTEDESEVDTEDESEVDTEDESEVDINTEDQAQASARSDVVTPEELTAARIEAEDAPPSDADGTVIEPESTDRPDLSELREELNDQFESIKILSPGQYELNLMELYDRDEYIISLREDGRYIIEMPGSWREPNEEE